MKRVNIAIFVLIVFSVACSSASSNQSATQTAFQEAVIAEVTVLAESITVTPEPSSTPTPAPSPTDDTEVKDYLWEINIHLDDYELGFEGFTNNLEELTENLAQLFFEDWQNSMNDALVLLKDSSRSMKFIKPPEKCESLYDEIATLEKKTRLMSDNFERGLVTMDASDIEKAISHLDEIIRIKDLLDYRTRSGKCG